MLSASGPIRKAGGGGGGGGAVHCPFKARYEKRRGGGGMLSGASGPIQNAGKGGGGGCLVEEGALPYMKGGVATPKPPPAWIRLC